MRLRPVLLLSLACAAPARPAATLAFTHATVVDVESGRLAPDQTVIVAGNRVWRMGPSARVRPPRGTPVVDARGKYLIPGLWDAHTHVGFDDPGALSLLMAHGVTSIRDMGASDFRRTLALRDSIAAGVRPGPRMKVAAPIVEHPRWMQFVRRIQAGEGQSTDWLDHRFGPSSAAEAAAWVDSVAALGVDHVKVRNYPEPDVLAALLRRARERGLPVYAHTDRSLAPAAASAAGMASFEHGFFPRLDAPAAGRDSIFRLLAARGTAVVPTLVTGRGRVLSGDALLAAVTAPGDARLRYAAPEVLQRWRNEARTRKYESPFDWGAQRGDDVRNVRELVAAGVVVLAGSDAGAPLVVAGFATHDELALLVEAGLTPLQALRSATLHPARFLGMADSLGTVRPGALADLVLLDGNPLEDIRNTRRIRAVVLNGRYLDRAALDRLLARAEHPGTR